MYYFGTLSFFCTRIHDVSQFPHALERIPNPRSYGDFYHKLNLTLHWSTFEVWDDPVWL